MNGAQLHQAAIEIARNLPFLANRIIHLGLNMKFLKF